MDPLTTITTANFFTFGKHVERLIVAFNGDGSGEGPGLSLSLQEDENGKTEVSRLFQSAGLIRSLTEDTLKIDHGVPEPELPSTEGAKDAPQEEQDKIVSTLVGAALNDMNQIGGKLYTHVQDNWTTNQYDEETRMKIASTLEAVNSMLSGIGEEEKVAEGSEATEEEYEEGAESEEQ